MKNTVEWRNVTAFFLKSVKILIVFFCLKYSFSSFYILGIVEIETLKDFSFVVT